MPVLDRIVEGLSPRVRGNQRAGDGGHRHDRSIPASAGEPDPANLQQRQTRVYPRECGGTSQAFVAVGAEQGLSPRVRGNLA